MMAKVHSDIVQSDGGGILESMVEDKSGSNIGRSLIFGLIFFFFFFSLVTIFADLNPPQKKFSSSFHRCR